MVDDVWADGDSDGGAEKATGSAELEREYEARQASYHAVGYRDGVAAAKEDTLQAGFDAGWAEGGPAGWAWGAARGAAGALRAFSAAHPGVPVTARDSRVTPDQEAALLEALGSGALGLSADVLPHIWPQLDELLTARSGGQPVTTSEDCRRVVAAMAMQAQSGHESSAEGTARTRLAAAGDALRMLGVRLQSWPPPESKSPPSG